MNSASSSTSSSSSSSSSEGNEIDDGGGSGGRPEQADERKAESKPNEDGSSSQQNEVTGTSQKEFPSASATEETAAADLTATITAGSCSVAAGSNPPLTEFNASTTHKMAADGTNDDDSSSGSASVPAGSSKRPREGEDHLATADVDPSAESTPPVADFGDQEQYGGESIVQASKRSRLDQDDSTSNKTEGASTVGMGQQPSPAQPTPHDEKPEQLDQQMSDAHDATRTSDDAGGGQDRRDETPPRSNNVPPGSASKGVDEQNSPYDRPPVRASVETATDAPEQEATAKRESDNVEEGQQRDPGVASGSSAVGDVKGAAAALSDVDHGDRRPQEVPPGTVASAASAASGAEAIDSGGVDSTAATEVKPPRQRWRAHQIAEDYVEFASNMMLYPVSTQLGPYGYDPVNYQYPLDTVSSLGFLKSPLRRPMIIERWSPYEIALFEASIGHYGKNFFQIHKVMETKSTKEIIDFYYIWKKTSHYVQWKKSYVPSHLDVSDDENESSSNNNNNGSGTSNKK